MPKQIVTWKIGGQAGDGQQVAGMIFSKACIRSGLFVFDTSEFPSLIRGGHVTYQVGASAQPIGAAYKQVDILLALNQETIDKHFSDLNADAVILYDDNLVKKLPAKKATQQKLGLPMAELAKQVGAGKIVYNIIGLGASLAVAGLSLELGKQLVAEIFDDKSQRLIALDQKALSLGYQYAKANLRPVAFGLPVKKSGQNKIIVTGNEAIALGALAAGCKIHVHYPMSPSSSILHKLAEWADRSGMVVKQPEDEISAMTAAIGASFAGVRAMTATSGGGFALMNESLSLAGITETPLVVVVSSRPGPATGLPTWTEQGDLQYVINAAHGEFPRVVLAPGDAQEAFYLTTQAFNLAEIYQLPVIILIDKYLSESHLSTSVFDQKKVTIQRGQLLSQSQLNKFKDYKRYQITKTGISPRAIPGQPGGTYLCNSDEHDEKGFSIEGWTPQMRQAQVEKRWRKIQNIFKDKNLVKPRLFGPAKSKATLIGWGSTKGPALEALKQLPNTNYLHVAAVYPLSETIIKQALKGAKKLIAIENNYQGQFANLLFAQTGIKVDRRLTKYSGRQFYPEEIIQSLKKI